MSNNIIMIIISSIVLSGIIFLVYYVINKQRRDNFKDDDSWKCIEGQCIKDINNSYNNIKGYDSEVKCKSDTNTQCGIKNVAKLTINTPPKPSPPITVKNNVLPDEGQKVKMLEEGFPNKEINTRPQQIQRPPQMQKKTIPSKVRS
jgi:hypothetical protein